MIFININSQLDHPHFLAISLVCLILAHYLENRLFSLTALVLLGYDFSQNGSLTASSILHYSFDLLLLSGLALISAAFSKGILRISYLPLSLLVLLLFHDFYLDKLGAKNGNTPIKLDTNNELLVQFESKETLHHWLQENKSTYEITYPLFKPQDTSTLLDEYLALNLEDGLDIQKAINEIEQHPLVIYVEPNEVLELELPQKKSAISFKPKANNQVTNDPLFKQQWGLDLTKSYYNKLAKAFAEKPSEEVLVVILDTGVEALHEDIHENFRSIDQAYDKDPRGHGTHCAGVAAAVSGNARGIASLLPRKSPIKISSVRVLNSLGIGTQAAIINGMIEAIDAGADVLSLSLGGITNSTKEKAYAEAVKYAQLKNCIVVVSAGNASADASNYSPANTKGVITVGALDKDFKPAKFSNYLDNIDMGIYAPGTDILSCYPENSYKALSGTSMAAPQISGFIGLLRCFDASLTAEGAYELLIDKSAKSSTDKVFNPEATIEGFLDNYAIVQ